MSEREALEAAADRGISYLESVDSRPVSPQTSPESLRARFSSELNDEPIDPVRVVNELAEAAEPGLVGISGGRYFGFVTGGAVPASRAADWLATAWDQNAFSYVASPAAAIAEDIAGTWIKELLRLPEQASTAFTTGCQMAHVTCFAAARHHLLASLGWDFPARGLNGAPRLRVVTGEKRHITVDRGLRLIGIGRDDIALVKVDGQGRMEPDHLRQVLEASTEPTIVVAQAGEVNTGSFDPLREVLSVARDRDAWIHVDGAFGIWARVSDEMAHHVEGLEEADSWAFDAHKWLNVPYDSGVAVINHPESHRAAMLGDAAYLEMTSDQRDAYDHTPDASRRARGFAVYAALRSLGKVGIVDMVERCCRHARRFADELSALDGAEILNEVTINQVLVRFTDDEMTARVLTHVQQSGVAWMGATTWNGAGAIRISVSSWATTDDDVLRTVEAFRAAVAEVG